ncbi:MAG TPA: SCO family protein [Gaiellaceae bacterium]|nr:SCO family protein [Gaiellaceae bacterium]
MATRASTPPARAGISRLRWAIWGTAALVGLGSGLGLFLTRSTTPASTSADVIGGPATTWPAGARPAPPIRLTDQNGKPVSLSAFRGRTVIVTFLDPLCRNYCPIEASRLNDVVRSLPAASRPAILAVSVNLYGNDRRYLVQDIHKWKAGPDWSWGIGDGSQLGTVWQKYGIAVLVTTKKLAGVTVHNVVHTEAAYVIDAKGDERALYLWPFTGADVRKTLVGLRS